jgi:hypothetical protein
MHITGTVQSWFEEHEGELQHLAWTAVTRLYIVEDWKENAV